MIVSMISLRPETSVDEPFLLSLYCSVRWPELDATGWPDDLKSGFLAGQFQFQRRQYLSGYAGLERSIIENDGVPTGRIYVARIPREIRVVDISLLPEWRGRGIGSRLLSGLVSESEAASIPLRLSVEQSNPALRLYRRLGFDTIDTSGLYWQMERSARIL